MAPAWAGPVMVVSLDEVRGPSTIVRSAQTSTARSGRRLSGPYGGPQAAADGPAGDGRGWRCATSRDRPPMTAATAAQAGVLAVEGSATESGLALRWTLHPQARPATRIVSHSRTAPACETGPFPSEDTATRAARALLSTSEAPSTHGGQDPGQVLFAQVKGTLIQTNDRR